MARPFETDYAGAWRGHCKTLENAVEAAVRHVLRDGYSVCTISGQTGKPLAWVERRGGEGFIVRVPLGIARQPKLRRVK